MPIAELSHPIYYEQHGEGDDLVLISGLTADHNVWSEMMEDLSKLYRVLVFDNPGVGRSYIPSKNYSLEDMSRDIAALLDDLGIHSTNFIGHSMGAALLMQLCINSPRKVKKAILCGGPASVPITAKLQVESLRYALKKNFPGDYISLSILPWLFGRRFLAEKDILSNIPCSYRAFASGIPNHAGKVAVIERQIFCAKEGSINFIVTVFIALPTNRLRFEKIQCQLR